MMSPATAADAIADEVRKRIPTLEQFAAMADQEGMGPDVTIPAIWMSLLLVHIKGLQETVRLQTAEVRLRDVQAVGALPRYEKPDSRADLDAYAAALANHAIRTMDGGQLEAASVIFHAGVATMMTALPKEGVIQVLSNLVDIFDLRRVFGDTEVAQ